MLANVTEERGRLKGRREVTVQLEQLVVAVLRRCREGVGEEEGLSDNGLCG